MKTGSKTYQFTYLVQNKDIELFENTILNFSDIKYLEKDKKINGSTKYKIQAKSNKIIFSFGLWFGSLLANKNNQINK